MECDNKKCLIPLSLGIFALVPQAEADTKDNFNPFIKPKTNRNKLKNSSGKRESLKNFIYKDYPSKIKKGKNKSAKNLKTNFLKKTEINNLDLNYHTVIRGECFSVIVSNYKSYYPGQTFYNLYKEFQKVNPLEDYDLIEVNQKITLPSTNFLAKEISVNKNWEKNPFEKGSKPLYEGLNTYRVKSGDTLKEIAEAIFPASNPKDIIITLMKLNPSIENPRFIQAGQIITLPNEKDLAETKIDRLNRTYTKKSVSIKSLSKKETIKVHSRKRRPSSMVINLNHNKIQKVLEKRILKNIQRDLRTNLDKENLLLSNNEKSTYQIYLRNLLNLSSIEEKIDELVFLKTLSKKLRHYELEEKFLKLISMATKANLNNESKITIDPEIESLLTEISS